MLGLVLVELGLGLVSRFSLLVDFEQALVELVLALVLPIDVLLKFTLLLLFLDFIFCGHVVQSIIMRIHVCLPEVVSCWGLPGWFRIGRGFSGRDIVLFIVIIYLFILGFSEFLNY